MKTYLVQFVAAMIGVSIGHIVLKMIGIQSSKYEQEAQKQYEESKKQ